MKYFFIILFLCSVSSTCAQPLQLHYDLRHSINPGLNQKNFPTLYFEYFKSLDSGKSFVKPGSFLLKTQADFVGEKNNIGKFYLQISQEFRFWKPKIFLTIEYSGGLGVTAPRQYSYYIVNTYSAGASYHFSLGGAFLTSVIFFKYVPYQRPSKDFLYTFYFYKGLWNYKAEFSGDFSLWTENKNHGDALTGTLSGKRFFFLAEPQFWINLASTFAIGTKVNTYYHVNTINNVFELYPAAAIRMKFK